jgi:phosphopantothenoylcysteine synthetase/decarboxylase
MRTLVTAGNTLVPIDQVRCLTNIFTGRTGTGIALTAHERGHATTLLTSHPGVVVELRETGLLTDDRWQVWPYRTFNDLKTRMETAICHGRFDAVIHCAAVSDYGAAGVYAPAPATRFDADTGRWERTGAEPPTLVDRQAAKIKSDEPELWLRLVRTPKLIDRIRSDWAYRGILVKFKLEVGVNEAELLTTAERSRRQSNADLMVANTLEGADLWAYLGPLAGQYQRVGRQELAPRLLDEIERLHKRRTHA